MDDIEREIRYAFEFKWACGQPQPYLDLLDVLLPGEGTAHNFTTSDLYKAWDLIRDGGQLDEVWCVRLQLASLGTRIAR